MGVDKLGVDKLGVDKLGVDKMRVNQIYIHRVGGALPSSISRRNFPSLEVLDFYYMNLPLQTWPFLTSA